MEKFGVKPEKVILFGSYSRGNPREDSDIDLLIISSNFSDMNLRERSELLGITAARILKPVEAIGYTPEEIENINPANFLSEVVKTGVKI